MKSMVCYSNKNGNGQLNLSGNTTQVTVAGPAPMVQQVAQQNFAMNNPSSTQQQSTAGDESNFFSGGNRAMGRFENPYLTKSPSQNTDEQKPAQKAQQNTAGQNAGSVNVVPIDKETPSTELKSDGITPYGSLSDALNARAANPSQSEQTKFKAAPEKKDGGFFNWVKSIMPKKRPGKRDGETDDEYDQRRTRNMQMVATFADAIRHIGNIVNTSKGAPLQKFNDTNAMLQEGYEKRKKERAAKAALDADAAEKHASLSLKERAAKADEAYKRMNLYLKKYGMDRQAAKDLAAAQRQQAQDKQEQDNWEKDFKEKERHHKATETISSSKGKGKGGSGGSGKSGGKYWFDDKNGKRHYQPNKTMYEQEFYREYGYYPESQSSTSTSTKSYGANGETTTTKTQKGAPMTAKAAKAQNDAAAKRKAAQAQNKKGAKPKQNNKPRSNNGYKNTKALGL